MGKLRKELKKQGIHAGKERTTIALGKKGEDIHLTLEHGGGKNHITAKDDKGRKKRWFF